MRALIADDDRATAVALQRTLQKWDLDAVVARDGGEALTILRDDPAIGLGIIDWMMPGIEGPELCRQLRADSRHDHMYLILVTHRDTRADLINGLDAGADDYIVKPFDHDELRARVHVGLRVLRLQHTLAERARELETAASRITTLHRLVPICSYCKKIRNDADYWQQLEDYIATQSDMQFTHGVCPSCYARAEDQMTGE